MLCGNLVGGGGGGGGLVKADQFFPSELQK